MSGLDMMMKSFGIDPEEIKKTIGAMGQGVVTIKERLDRIDKTQIEILELLKNGKPKSFSGLLPEPNDRKEPTAPGGNE